MKRQLWLFLWGSVCSTFLTLILWSVFGDMIALYFGVHSATSFVIVALVVYGSVHFYYRTMADREYEEEHGRLVHGEHEYAPFGSIARAIDKVRGNPELKYETAFSRWRHRPSVELGALIIGTLIGIFIVIPNLPI